MPTFDTPRPISVTVEIGIGDIRIAAGERIDTVVEVRPSDPGKKADVAAAERTRVEYADGRLLVRSPRGWRQHSLWGSGESIDVEVSVPTGSHLRTEAGVATVRGTGLLGECSCQTGAGDIRLDQAGPAHLRTGAGDISATRVLEHAEVITGTGAVQVGSVEGTAVVKNSNGDTWIGEVTGDLRVNAANGRIAVDIAHAAVAAKTAMGDVRIGEVERGTVLAQTAFGKLEVGVRDGVAAWLDLDTRFGNVHNDLDAAEPPARGKDMVEVRARTSYGDISVTRSSPATSG